MFKKFDEQTIDEFMELISRNKNPFTKIAFFDREREFVTEMMMSIYAAVHDDKDILFDPVVTINISVLDINIRIKRTASISQLSESISKAIAPRFSQNYERFSQDNIRTYYNKFLLKKGLIELRDNPYENGKSYFATELGKNCGLSNTTKTTKQGQKSHKLNYSAYMQAYLLRKFPEIFIFAIKSEFKKTYFPIEDLIEPLTLEEQKIISDFRQLSPNCQKQVQNTIKALRSSSGAAQSVNNGIS